MNLLLFLSDRCNMSCHYCFLSLNRHPSTILGEAEGARAIDAHLNRCGRGARVTLLGGEPLLHPELALTLARRARRGGAKVTLVTNAVKASPAVVDELLSLDAEVVVSIDGAAPTHDKHRRFVAGGPTHAAVATAITRLDRSRLRVNMVLSEDTVGAFLSNVEWLRARGFMRLSFHVDVVRPWSSHGLNALAVAMQGFVRYARVLERAAPGSLSLWHLETYSATRTGRPSNDEDRVLGADGRYYASDAWLSRPYGRGLDGAVGDVVSGVDESRRRALLSEADQGVFDTIGEEPYYTWPRESWLLSKLGGHDAAVGARSFHRADTVLGDALADLAREGAGR